VKVLVTGSGGFLGRHFYKAHRDKGDMVFGVDNLSGDNPDTSCVDNDQDIRDFLGHPQPWDLVYHFAAPVGGRLKIEGDPMFNADSLSIDAEFFRWLARVEKKPRVVYPSSSAVYGYELQQQGRKKPLYEVDFEASSHEWLAPDELYGFTKLAGEYLAWKVAGYGVNTLCIRPFSGYGEGQSFDYPIPSIAARALRQENPLTIWGSGQQTRDFVHVDDIVRITRKRLAAEPVGYQTLNIGSSVATSFYEIATIFAELIGYQPVIVSDETKPQGVYDRFADTRRMNLYAPEKLIPLREGLTRVLADVDKRLAVPA